MAFTTALQGRQPIIDLASIDAKAQRYRDNELDLARKSTSNNVFNAKAANDINHEQALGDYRAKKSAGQDDEAMAALDAYPEDQRKLYDAFDGMSPEDFEGARSRARAFGAAAQFVSQFPDGSPQRVDAWRKSIDKLLQDGHLDEDSAQKLIETGPNDLIIDQALTIDQYTQKYAGPKSAKDNPARAQAEIDNIAADNAREDKRLEAELAKNRGKGKAVTEQPKLQTIFGADGSKVTAGWNSEKQTWEPVGTGEKTKDPAQGKPARKLTEQQSKDLVYFQRGEAALTRLDEMEDALTSYKDTALDYVPLANNALTSVDYQKANQAGREFLAAVLRKDTGAAITEQEMDIYGKMYLPQPGEGKEILAQKKEARRVALDAIKTGLGTAAAVLTDKEAEEPVTAPSGPKQGEEIDGHRYIGGDPNSESSWESVDTPMPSATAGQGITGGGDRKAEYDIPQEAIEQLTQDPSPEMRRYFDETFGEGAAAYVVGE